VSVSGVGVAAVGAGSLLVWSGIRGWSVLATFGDLVTGHRPNQTAVNSLTTGAQSASFTSGMGPTTGLSGSTLADTAKQYIGHGYRFGGAPGADGSGLWDCSSFVNWVASVKLGRAIPGYGPGKYRGSAHGPPTGSWAVWPGLMHVAKSDIQAGDIIVWAGHMGIATSHTTMVSALNPRSRTQETPIAGYGNGPLITVGRYR
jgi:cell wall-associated NlpC family hydrolase